MSKKEKEEAKPKEATKEKKAEKPPAEAPPVKEEVKPEKAEKAPKPQKKKKKDKKIFTLYKVENDKLTRLLPVCERCGTGYFMADHGNRYSCGHCGFTRYKPARNEHV